MIKVSLFKTHWKSADCQSCGKTEIELHIARIIGFVEMTMEETAMQVLSTKDKLTFVRMLRDKLTNNHDIYEVPKTKIAD